jgi:tetratricopeptide (TPR) repeat protein
LSEAFSAERLAQLEERWRREPHSRVFLQLAEEHRRGGDLRRAAEVLEQGLAKHPGYVSALVLLGRCRLEAGDPPAAIESLERAVVHDPAQLVANKLLVEAYLATGRTAQARERIEFYRLFNDRDPEIDELERRIDARVAAIATTPSPATREDLFDLPPAALPPLELPIPARRREPGAPEPFGDVHDPQEANRRIEAAIAAEGIFPLAVPAPVAAAVAAEPSAPAAIERGRPDFADVFDLAPPGTTVGTAQLEDAGLAVTAGPVEPEETAYAAAPETSWIDEPATEAGSESSTERSAPPWGFRAGGRDLDLEAREQVVAEPFSPRSIGEEVERETIEEPFDEVLTGGGAATAMPAGDFPAFAEEAPAVGVSPEAPVEVGPSSTLGELYLAQGHLEEAASEFRRVLAIRPDDAVARAGLDEIERRHAPVEETASGWREGAAPAAPVGGLTQRKVATLRRYLDRLRRGRERLRVS